MTGQRALKALMKRHADSGHFPGFCLIAGRNGYEVNEVAHYAAGLLGCMCIDVVDGKIDTIRNVIRSAYKLKTRVIYNLTGSESMSRQAQNALLKVTEEPPNNAIFFIPTTWYDDALIEALFNRAYIYNMEPYTDAELVDYFTERWGNNSEYIRIMREVCQGPVDIDELMQYDPVQFYRFVEKVVDNIAETSGSNAFKIAQSISLKGEEDPYLYDLRLFWRVFSTICYRRKYYNAVIATSRALRKLREERGNKQMLFDEWILEVRRTWKDGYFRTPETH